MKLTRREFFKLCASSAAGVGISQLYVPEVVAALENAADGNPPVIWLQGQSDSGCSVSLLNTTHPSISEVLLKVISLRYHATIMAATGETANQTLEDVKKDASGKFILIVEGSIPTKGNGEYCVIGENDGKHITLADTLKDLAPHAAAIVAVGACAAFGGIPAAKPNPTGAMSVSEFLGKPVVNIPGCPAHPDWIVGTLVHVLLYGMPDLDTYGRPVMFFGQTIHENCPRYYYFADGQYASNFGEEGCLIQLGCKGPVTNSDCPSRRWNNGVNWCIGNGGMCIGCCAPNFPDGTGSLYTALPKEKWPNKESKTFIA
ncbi:MAG: hydrogenase small subunit [PVC group bacterium]|nr:hydrogenase small subunit [PVC group bacterium]